MVFTSMLPTFRISLMDITPDIIEKSTIGTTINFTRFRNRVPNGLIYVVAISGVFINPIPARIPRRRPVKIQKANGNFFFVLLITLSPLILFSHINSNLSIFIVQ